MADESVGPFAGLALPRALTVLAMGAAATISVAGLRSAPSIGPILLSLILIVIAWPAAQWTRDRGLPGWTALVALLGTAYGIVLVMLAAMAWSVAQLAEYITRVDYQRQLSTTQADLIDLLDRFGVSDEQMESAIDSIDVSAITSRVVSAFSGVLGVGGIMTLVVMAVLFMALDASSFVDRLDDSLGRSRPDIREALSSFASATRSYFLVSTGFGFVVAVLDVIALLVLDIPLAVTWGVLSLITNYIPNIGFVVGMIPPALIALLEHDWQRALIVVVVYTLINVIIQTLIQPKIVGDAMGLSATISFVSLIFWAFVIGPIGSLIAVPLTLLAKALLVDVDRDAAWLEPLISLESPEARSERVDPDDVELPPFV